jgi:diguanylate cyclase (GGDEF)-like protein
MIMPEWSVRTPPVGQLRLITATGIFHRMLVLGLLMVSVFSSSIQATETKNAAQSGWTNSRLPLILDRPIGLPRALFPFRSYGTDSGLGNLAARRIVQDSTGFLWVGTEDGLYRYDGDRFTRFDSSNGLPSTWVTDLLATPDDNLWVCTPKGLAIRNGDRFEVIKTESTGLPGGYCNAVALDGRGVIWVAHKDGLFYIRNQRFHRILGLPSGPATAVASAPGNMGAVFVAVKGMVFRISEYRLAGKYMVWPDASAPIDSLAVDRSGKVWAQSVRKLFLLSPGSAAFQEANSDIPSISSRGVLSTDRGGRLWVPTDEGMSCRVNEHWEHFGVRDGLPTDWTRYIFEDRDGSYWIGSLGVHRLIGRGSWTSWTIAQGLSSDTIWHIHRSRSGDLWVATDRGLCLASPRGWHVLPGTEKTVVRRILEDSRGRIWVALVPAGILRYDPATHLNSRYERSSGVAGTRVLCIEEDAAGEIWAATDGAGLLRYRAEKNDFVRAEVPQGTPDETFRFILRDKQDRLWATGENGLLLRSGGKWQRFGRDAGLQQDHVSYIAQMASGEFWLSYFEPLGLVRFSFENDTFKILSRLGSKNGLSSEKVYLLGEDLNSNLWVGTGKGIDVFSPEGVLHFSKGDGVAGDDLDAMAYLVEPSGSVFVGTSSGLSMYRSDSDAPLTQCPTPVFLDANINGRQLLPARGNPQTFGHEFNTLKIDFAVLSFLHESQIEYGTRLGGLETEWHNSRFRETRYPGLAPGAYVYEVRARIGSGPWSQPATIALKIQQPWWRTWPAIALWVVLVASAAFAGFRWRLGHLRNRTRQLENLISARTLELAIANADLERLSITDPLTGLKNRRFLEFSIVEDLARIRRSFQPADGEWRPGPGEGPNISFLLVDVDHFKLVNDRYGHTAGDQVLRQMGTVLSFVIRESDTTVRWGGEEFLIIARNPKVSDPAVLAERIRKQVESTEFIVSEDQVIRLTCSIGFASWPFFRHEPDALRWQDVLDLSDRCLYLAKNSGRNAWIGAVIRPEYSGNAEYAMLNDLRTAESAGIVEIQSSAYTVLREHPYHYTPRTSLVPRLNQ